MVPWHSRRYHIPDVQSPGPAPKSVWMTADTRGRGMRCCGHVDLPVLLGFKNWKEGKWNSLDLAEPSGTLSWEKGCESAWIVALGGNKQCLDFMSYIFPLLFVSWVDFLLFIGVNAVPKWVLGGAWLKADQPEFETGASSEYIHSVLHLNIYTAKT